MRVSRVYCSLFLFLSIYKKGQEQRNKTTDFLCCLWGRRRSHEVFSRTCRKGALSIGTRSEGWSVQSFSSGTLLGNEYILGPIERDAHFVVQPLPAQTGKDGSQFVAVRPADIGALFAEALG